MEICFSAPILLMYRLQDTSGCNINPSHYQNSPIYIQHLPSRLFLFLKLHFQNKQPKSGFRQKTEKMNTSEYLRKVLLGFDDVIKKKRYQKDYSKSFILS